MIISNSTWRVNLDEVLITESLSDRSPRSPDLAAENATLHTLARQATQPDALLKTLATSAQQLCSAGSAGVSLLETLPSGETILRWVAVSGALAECEQDTILSQFSMCGVCLDRRSPQLFAAPERCFPALQPIQPPIVEQLVVPFGQGSQPLGTIWIAAHDEKRLFDREDVRLLTSLADFTAGLNIYFRDIGDRKVAEGKLRRSHIELEAQVQKFDVTLSTITDFVFNFDKDGRILYANQVLLDWWGLSAADAIGKTMAELNYSEAIEQHLMADLLRVFEAKTIVKGETPYTSPTGVSGYFEYVLNPAFAADGSVAFVAGSAREISDRLWAEVALRQSEERYRTLFESIDEGFCIVEVLVDSTNTPIDHRILEINPTFEQQTGLRQAVGRTARQLGMEERWIEIYGQVALTGEAVRFENGSNVLGRWFDVYACRMGEPADRKVAIVFKDISDRKRAEAVIAADLRDTQRLRELGARLVTEGDTQTLYQEIISAAIALTAADAGTVQILDAATQDLVLLATQGFDRTMTEHFHRVNACSNTPCGLALRQGERIFLDFDVPASEDLDGSLRMHVEAGYRSGQSTPLITRSGRPIGMVSTHWCQEHRPSDRELRFLDLLARQAADLIEQRQAVAAQEQLLMREQAARAASDRANRLKDEFLAVLSHELRSPLNPILGWSKLLQQGNLDAAKTATALATIERNAQLQTQLIDDLLDISRILRGKLSLNHQPVDLGDVIAAALETVRLAAEAKSLQIDTVISPERGSVIGDAGRLQQVVWNLLSNAVKFTPAGGQIRVSLTHTQTHAQLQVVDTGKGIKPEFLPDVFEHFRQEDGATTRKFGGLGLGLAIVRQLVELHGGTVAAESPGEGQGATFTVQIPIASDQSVSPVIEPPARSANDLSGIRILVVDDERDSRELVAFVLEQAGAIVTTAASGLAALQAYSQSALDLIVSDIGMPQMDGYMLMRQIRSLPAQGRPIPAIALTAYAGELNQQQAIAAGFQRHLAKPIDPEVVVAMVTELVSSA